MFSCGCLQCHRLVVECARFVLLDQGQIWNISYDGYRFSLEGNLPGL